MVKPLTEPAIEDKRITLAEAAKMVPDGSTLFWGGFGYQRPPIAFASELARQKKRNLTITTCGSEVDLEIMAGAGVASRYEIAFSAIEALGLSIELMNTQGQIIYRNDVKTISSYNETIDVDGFAKGVYFLRVNTGKAVKVKKVLIE